MQVVDKQVNDLIPYENNPRNNNEAIPEVAKALNHSDSRFQLLLIEII